MTVMEFGVALPQTGQWASPQALRDVAAEAERGGFATLWVLERILRPVGSAMPASYATAFDPLATLAWVAAQTSRIRLGTSIIDALFHAPVILAKRFATLDRLSEGRVVAGLGQGYAPEEFATANVPVSRRGRGFEECVAAMRAAWGPDPVAFTGRVYRIPESEIGPKPLQPGGPPVIIAAREEPAVRRTGRIADGFNPVARRWEDLERMIGWYREAAAAAGRGGGRVIVRANSTVGGRLPEPRDALTGSFEQIAEDLRRLRALGVDEVFFDMNRFPIAPLDQVRLVERLRASVA